MRARGFYAQRAMCEIGSKRVYSPEVMYKSARGAPEDAGGGSRGGSHSALGQRADGAVKGSVARSRDCLSLNKASIATHVCS